MPEITLAYLWGGHDNVVSWFPETIFRNWNENILKIKRSQSEWSHVIKDMHLFMKLHEVLHVYANKAR